MFPSVCAFLVFILIIIVGFYTIWRKDIQMNQTNATAQLNRNSAALASVQHLNALNSFSSYATPATTLHHNTSSTNQCGHFDEQQHSCISGEEHLLTDACFQLSSTTANNGCSNFNNNCNHYTLNTFAPAYAQSNHDAQNSTDQFKEFKESLNNCNNLNNCNTLNSAAINQAINTAINKPTDCQDCHSDCHLMPTPYASNQIDYDRVLKQTTSISNQLANATLTNNTICTQHSYTVTPITTGTLNQQASTNQMPAPNFSFDRYNNCPNGTGNNSEHTYDIPIPPKWV